MKEDFTAWVGVVWILATLVLPPLLITLFGGEPAPSGRNADSPGARRRKGLPIGSGVEGAHIVAELHPDATSLSPSAPPKASPAPPLAA